jgi:hypothetical protein
MVPQILAAGQAWTAVAVPDAAVVVVRSADGGLLCRRTLVAHHVALLRAALAGPDVWTVPAHALVRGTPWILPPREEAHLRVGGDGTVCRPARAFRASIA